MDNESIIDRALAMLGDDMDGMEGKSAMAHGMDECPDPLNCDQHDDEMGDALGGDKGDMKEGMKPALTIEVHGEGMSPAEGMGDGLKEDEAEELKKLLGK